MGVYQRYALITQRGGHSSPSNTGHSTTSESPKGRNKPKTKMVKNEKDKKKYLPTVMKENGAVFSLTLSDGFANISFDDKGDASVEFLNEEGYNGSDISFRMTDIQKVARFMEEMRDLRLQDFVAPTDQKSHA
jgi:hypothetical protein